MKKVLFSVLAVGLLAGLGSGFAQTLVGTADHVLTIDIPALLGVRIVDSSGAATTSAGVNFDFVTDPTNYIAAVTGTGSSLPPTSTPNFGDVQVMNNTGNWSLSVKASSLNYTSGAGAGGISLADITVAPSPASAPVTSVNSRTLSATESAVAVGTRTAGWVNVGIDGSSYALAVNGDENPGTYTTTVTYTLYAL